MNVFWILGSVLFLATAPCYAGETGDSGKQSAPALQFNLPSGNYSLGFETTAPNSGAHPDTPSDPRKDSLGLDTSLLHDDSAPGPSGVLAPKRDTLPFLGLKLSKPLAE